MNEWLPVSSVSTPTLSLRIVVRFTTIFKDQRLSCFLTWAPPLTLTELQNGTGLMRTRIMHQSLTICIVAPQATLGLMTSFRLSLPSRQCRTKLLVFLHFDHKGYSTESLTSLADDGVPFTLEISLWIRRCQEYRLTERQYTEGWRVLNNFAIEVFRCGMCLASSKRELFLIDC